MSHPHPLPVLLPDDRFDAWCPWEVTDGGWGGPLNWLGLWTCLHGAHGFGALDVLERGRRIDPLQASDLMEQNLDYQDPYWRRLWDSSLKQWRALTEDELKRLPPAPRDAKEWMTMCDVRGALYGTNPLYRG